LSACKVDKPGTYAACSDAGLVLGHGVVWNCAAVGTVVGARLCLDMCRVAEIVSATACRLGIFDTGF
jgi:hypothetical protein